MNPYEHCGEERKKEEKTGNRTVQKDRIGNRMRGIKRQIRKQFDRKKEEMRGRETRGEERKEESRRRNIEKRRELSLVLI